MQPSQPSQQPHNEGFKAARNLESTGMSRDQAEAIVKTATSEAILIVNTHALSKEGLEQELGRRDYATRADVKTILEEELDKRDYATQGQLAVLATQMNARFTEVDARFTKMDARITQVGSQIERRVIAILGTIVVAVQVLGMGMMYGLTSQVLAQSQPAESITAPAPSTEPATPQPPEPSP
ncbi:MAG: hypothetical protein ACR2PR_02250 [Pseudohongiellaceae bacterium]